MDIPKVVLPEEKRLKNMVSKNASLQNLIDKLDLELETTETLKRKKYAESVGKNELFLLKQEKWRVEELSNFFNELPEITGPIQLKKEEVISDVKKFVNSHLEIVRYNENNPVCQPYYDRLCQLKKILEEQK